MNFARIRSVIKKKADANFHHYNVWQGKYDFEKRFETRFEESTSTEVDSSVTLTHYDPKNLGLIC